MICAVDELGIGKAIGYNRLGSEEKLSPDKIFLPISKYRVDTIFEVDNKSFSNGLICSAIMAWRENIKRYLRSAAQNLIPIFVRR
jgi:hypothetical protein